MTNLEVKQAMTTPEGKCYCCGKTSHRTTSYQLHKCYWRHRALAMEAGATTVQELIANGKAD